MIQVLVFGVVGVLSETVRRHAVALTDGGPASAVGRYDNTNRRSVRLWSCGSALMNELSSVGARWNVAVLPPPPGPPMLTLGLTWRGHSCSNTGALRRPASPEQVTCRFEQVNSYLTK